MVVVARNVSVLELYQGIWERSEFVYAIQGVFSTCTSIGSNC